MLHLSTQAQAAQTRVFGAPAPRLLETSQARPSQARPSQARPSQARALPSPLGQPFRSSTPPALPGRSLARNLRDNNFAGARESAVLAPGYGSRGVLFNGRVGRRDPIDVFKVTLLPNASISNLSASRQTIRQAPLNFQMIGDIRGNKITLIGANFAVSDLPPESYPIQPRLVNQTGEPVDFYFRFAAVGRRESRYNLAFRFFQ